MIYNVKRFFGKKSGIVSRELCLVETELRDSGPDLRGIFFINEIKIRESVDLQKGLECRPVFICKAVDRFQVDEFLILPFVKPKKLPGDKNRFGQQFRGISLPAVFREGVDAEDREFAFRFRQHDQRGNRRSSSVFAGFVVLQTDIFGSRVALIIFQFLIDIRQDEFPAARQVFFVSLFPVFSGLQASEG